MRKYPLGAWREAREALCADKPPLAYDDEKPSHDRRERHFRGSVELESLVHLEPLPARNCDHLRRDGVRETGGHRVPSHRLLVKVFAEPFVGAGSLLAGDHDLRNTRWARFDRKKTSFHVRSGEYVTPRMFTLLVKVSACFRSSSSL